LSNLHRESPLANPCPDEECFVCSDARAQALATHLGLADEPDPTIEADARAADSIRWGLWSPDLPRTYRDEDGPDELVEAFEFPDEEDDAARLELFPWATEGGCFEDDLTPEEEEILLWGESEWSQACREFADWMEERELEALYLRRVEALGGFSADY
jgi:hypothetical protein